MVKYVALIYRNVLNLILNCILNCSLIWLTSMQRSKTETFVWQYWAIMGHCCQRILQNKNQIEESGFLNLYQFMPHFLIKIQGTKFRWYLKELLLSTVMHFLNIFKCVFQSYSYYLFKFRFKETLRFSIYRINWSRQKMKRDNVFRMKCVFTSLFA